VDADELDVLTPLAIAFSSVSGAESSPSALPEGAVDDPPMFEISWRSTATHLLHDSSSLFERPHCDVADTDGDGDADSPASAASAASAAAGSDALDDAAGGGAVAAAFDGIVLRLAHADIILE